MVLSLLRRKARSTFIYVAFGIIIVVFIFYFGWGSRGSEQPENWAAKVGKQRIEYSAYLSYYKNLVAYYRDMYKDNFDSALIEQLGLKQQALDALIEEFVVLESARKAGVQVSMSEIRESIRNLEAFQTDGAFDLQKYKILLKRNRIQPGDFEETQAQNLMVDRIQGLVRGGTKLSGTELWDQFVYENEKARLEYVEIDPQKMVADEAVTAEAAEAYYEQNKERFRVPEKISVAYVEFSPKSFKDKIDISDKEIEDYYEEYADEFWEPEKVRARHILVRVEAGAPPEEKEQARKKAEDILDRVNGGEDFAELATELSEDKGSAKEGGDLGFFARGQMVKPFEEAAFALDPGGVSEPVETTFGFHIIKVEEKTSEGTKPLELVRNDISQGLFDAAAAEAIRKEAFRTYRSALKEKDLVAYAEESDLAVLAAGPFSRRDGHAIFAEAPDSLEEAFSVDAGEMIYPFTGGESYFVAKVVEEHESYISQPEEVQGEIEAILQQQQQKAAAHKEAQALLARAQEAESLEAVAKQDGLEVENTRLFSRSGKFVPGFGRSQELLITAFSLSPDNPFPDDVFEHNEKYYVLRLLGREKAIEEDFEKKKDALRQKQLKQKKNEYLAAWMGYARSRSNIVVNPRVLQ